MCEDELVLLCALSGCDYLPSVQGMGLKKAHRLVSRHKEVRASMPLRRNQCPHQRATEIENDIAAP